MRKRVFVLFFIILLASMLYACQPDVVTDQPKVESIAVDGMKQIYYFMGDELNFSEASLYVMYEDGKIETLPLDHESIKKIYNIDTPGEKIVTVTYKGASTQFKIQVLDLIVEKVLIGSLPNKTVYIEGTEFDVTGATIDVYFEGGRVMNMPVMKDSVTQYNPNVVGEQLVEITYRAQTLYIPITIVPKELQSISVKTPPLSKSVYIGYDINSVGMVLYFHYNNGKKEEVNARDLEDLRFEFDNTRPTPSTDVKVFYTLKKDDGGEQEFQTSFKIQVLDRKFKSMRIVEYPVTNGILLEKAQYDDYGNLVREEVRTASTSINNIVQGDTINLQSGMVEVTFEDGSKQTYLMNDHVIKVYNKQQTEKAEIEGLVIEPIEKKDVAPGDCFIDYNIRISDSLYKYDSEPQIKITAQNSAGAAVPVIKSGEKSLIEVGYGEYYTVTITATVIDNRSIDGVWQDVELTTVKSFRIMGQGAVEPRRTLDISAAGDYVLSVIYMENPDWSVPMSVKVVSRTPERLELSDYTDVTEKEYVVGDKINISFVKYRIIYNNGDIDPWAPVTTRMLAPEVTLNCDYVSSIDRPKRIYFTIMGISSDILEVKVVPLGVSYLEIEPPTNTYVARGDVINPAGGTLTAYMNNKTKLVYSLPAIVGIGEDKAQIINDPLSEENSIVREQPYLATVRFKGAEVTFEYFVVDRVIESLQLIRSGEEKTTYFENEPLDLTGLSLRIKWRNSSIIETKPVTMDMLYQYDPYKTGPQTLKIRYWGVVNESFAIMVYPKQIVSITITQMPKLIYIYNQDLALDLSGIRIEKTYNDGSKEEQIGITLGLDQRGYGWTYNSGQINFKEPGVKQVILTYRDQANYDTPIQISYEIEVTTTYVEAIYLHHPDGPPQSDLIATVAKGMGLNLINAVIYVKYAGISEIRTVPLTPGMINYERSDTTIGDRRVLVTYSGVSCPAYIRVLDSELYSVSVETLPKTNYMVGEKLDLSQGTVRRNFRYAQGSDLWWDIMPMQVDGITVQGFNENLKESDFAENEQYKEMIVTVTYMGFNYSFNVRIYKKFNAALSYYSTISFYGDVSMPYISVNTDVEGFTLPEITLSFINSMDVISSLPVGAEEIVSTDAQGNTLYVRYKSGTLYYIKVVLANGNIGYIKESLIIPASDYPVSPPQGGNMYLILARVQGNKYYNAINYAIREFKIVNKYISVNAVVPNEDAVVWKIQTTDNARAVYLAGLYIDYLTENFGSLDIFLASPTYDGFEVVITRWGSIDLNGIRADLEAEITSSWWSYYVEQPDGSLSIREVKQTNTPQGVIDPKQKVVEILSLEQRTGVNYRIFDEGQDILSYYVPSGGLIPVRDAQNFFVMELFSGRLYRDESMDVLYDVEGVLKSGYDIEDDELQRAVVAGYPIVMDKAGYPKLSNPNYFLNFFSQSYVIAPKAIVQVRFNEIESYKYEYGGKEYPYIRKGYSGSPQTVHAQYRDRENGPWMDFDMGQIRYYRIEDGNEISLPRGQYPVSAGIYRARITHNYKAQEGHVIADWQCILQIF